MNAVDLQQIGRMAEAVERNTDEIKDVKATVKEIGHKVESEVKGFYEHLEGHMEKEEEERKEMIKLIEDGQKASQKREKEAIARDVKTNDRLNKLEWRLGLIAAVLGMGGSAVGPFIGRLVETAFIEDIAVSVLTYLPW